VSIVNAPTGLLRGRLYDATEAIDPTTGHIAPLFHPRRDVWSAHFLMQESGDAIDHTDGSCDGGKAGAKSPRKPANAAGGAAFWEC
jgi:hypothetical protein